MTYCNDWAATSSSLMLGLLENVFPRECPMSPSKVPDLVKSLEINLSRQFICQCELLDAGLFSGTMHPFEKLPVVSWSIRTEVLEDIGQGRVRHIDLEQVITQRNLNRRMSLA
jgi:hypothetical protein